MPQPLAVCFHGMEWVCGTCGKCTTCCTDKSHVKLIHSASREFAELKRAIWLSMGEPAMNPDQKAQSK